MKRKITLALSMLLVVLMLGACGTDPATVDYNGRTYDSLMEESSSLITALSEMTDEYIEYYLSSGDEFIISLVTAWSDNTAELGDFIDYDDFTVTKSGSTLTTDMLVHFSDRDVVFELVYNYYDMSVPTGVTVEPVYTLGEKMQKAGLNTIISMLIVFLVLILISLIIYCFKFIHTFQDRKKKKDVVKQEPVVQDQVVTQIEQRETQQSADDTELIAVIAAAIAASTGTSTSDFVVRSINRR